MNLPSFDNLTTRLLPAPVGGWLLGDEDLAVRRDDDVGRLVERVRAVAGDAGLAERHQQLAVGTELEDLMAFAARRPRVGHPDVAVAIDREAVRERRTSLRPTTSAVCPTVELEDRRFGSSGAGILEAAMHDVDVAVRPGSAPMTAAHFSPAGSWPQSATRRYGFGCAEIATAAATATATPALADCARATVSS